MDDGPVRRVLDALTTRHGHAPARNGHGWHARCPAHDDQRPSLSISEGRGGRALIKCHAGCPADAVMSALGLKLADLMPDNGRRPAPSRRAAAGDGRPERAERPAHDGTARKPRVFLTAADAVRELERRHGKCAARWIYHNAAGEPCGVVVRWDLDDHSKEVRPVSRVAGGWACRAMPAPRPLYALGELREAPRVFVCEGEKCAEMLRQLGLTATTSAGGAQAARQTDWRPLAPKQAYIADRSAVVSALWRKA